MIHRIDADCRFQGDNFSPKLAESRTGLTVTEKNEPGEIGHIGRYRGTPVPYGSCKLEPPPEAKRDSLYSGLDWLLDMLDGKLSMVLECGAVDPVIYLAVYYGPQCNFEFSPDQLKKIAKLNIPLAISCYETSD